MVYEHRHLATKTYSYYTFTDTYYTNFMIQVVHIITHFLIILYMRKVKELSGYWSKTMNVQPHIMVIFLTLKMVLQGTI